MGLISSFWETEFNPVTFQAISQSKIRTDTVVSIWREREHGQIWRKKMGATSCPREPIFAVKLILHMAKKGEMYGKEVKTLGL